MKFAEIELNEPNNSIFLITGLNFIMFSSYHEGRNHQILSINDETYFSKDLIGKGRLISE